MMSQVVVHVLDSFASGVVPILIKMQQLQRLLLADTNDAFAKAVNWIDAYLQLEHAKRPALYRMLRQAMLARRALLLLDGLDEGGVARRRIERHVVEVLVPQGHVVLATSRPVGVPEWFQHSVRLSLSPLSDEQQRLAVEQRVGVEARERDVEPHERAVAPRDARERGERDELARAQRERAQRPLARGARGDGADARGPVARR